MKKVIFFIGLFFPLLSAAQSLTPEWSTPPALKTPESVYYNAQDHLVYVSNINGNPSTKDGNGFISILNEDGKILQLKWVTGLNAPKGMTMSGNYLYVSDVDRLAKIDIRNGNIVKFYPAAGAKFLNDVQVGDQNLIYITDSRLGAIYVFDENRGQIYKWMSGPVLKGANGLAWERGKLLVGVNGYLLQVDPKKQIVKKLIVNKGGIDGLVPLGGGKYLVSDWAGKIQIISPHKKPVVVSNTTSQKINAADLGYIPLDKLVMIPTFFNNRVVGQKLNRK